MKKLLMMIGAAAVEGGWDAVVSCGAKEEVIKGWRERAADFNKY